MKRARDTSFVPWDGGVRTIHYRQAFEDDDPVVVAFPTLFEPLPTAGKTTTTPVAEAVPTTSVAGAVSVAARSSEPSVITPGWQDDEPVDRPVVKDRRGRGRREVAS